MMSLQLCTPTSTNFLRHDYGSRLYAELSMLDGRTNYLSFIEIKSCVPTNLPSHRRYRYRSSTSGPSM